MLPDSAGWVCQSQVMNLFLNYFKAEGSANDGQHERIDGWYWWSWNANSGDTGGVVSSSSPETLQPKP